MKAIKLYWCTGRGLEDHSKRNFGDYLSADLVEMVSERKVVHAQVKTVLARDILANKDWSLESELGDYHRPGLAQMQEGLIKAFPRF